VTRNAANDSPPAILAIDLLDAFAERTGLNSAQHPSRYLWTDAFDVCGWIGLHESTGMTATAGSRPEDVSKFLRFVNMFRKHVYGVNRCCRSVHQVSGP
jgi:hypothetical protein